MNNTIEIQGWIKLDDRNIVISKNKNGYGGDTLAEIIDRKYIVEEQQLSSMGEPDEEMGGVSLYIPNCSLQFYTSDNEIGLQEVEERYLIQLYGGIDIFGENFGYSMYTILGFDVENLTIGGHDLQEILSNYQGKYINMIIKY